jgi:hypothetical protein
MSMTEAELILRLQSDAHDMGDDFGQDPETALILSKEYDLNPHWVQMVLSGVDTKIFGVNI